MAAAFDSGAFDAGAFEVGGGGGTQNLSPSLYTQSQTFYAATVSATYALTVSPVENTSVFFGPTITQVTTLLPARYDNANAFYSPTLTPGAVTLSPARYDNSNSFYSATVTAGTVTLLPARYDNTQTFYSPIVTQAGGTQYLLPPLVVNNNQFFPAVVSQVSELGGGGPSKGWSVERQRLELSLEQRSAVETLSKSKNKTVKRIAKRLDRYITAQLDIDAELAEIARLEVEFAKLETLHNNRAQLDNDLREAARIMQEFVQDEQDAITLLMLTDDFDTRCVIEATVGPLNLASLVGL